jgi:hypothetical protein
MDVPTPLGKQHNTSLALQVYPRCSSVARRTLIDEH